MSSDQLIMTQTSPDTLVCLPSPVTYHPSATTLHHPQVQHRTPADQRTLTPTSSATSESEKDGDPTRSGIAILSDPEVAPAAASEPVESSPPAPGLLQGLPLLCVVVSMLLSMFLVALDRFIIATAIPVITAEFHALDQAPWLATAYFLAQGGLVLTFGQVTSILPTKWVFIFAIGVFELGSLICGVAPSMNVLIFGRAVAGFGSAGVLVSILAIVAQVSRLDQRPTIFGCFAGTNALGSILGPLVGGAFSDHISWRWVFYINLPLGVPTLAAAFLFLKPNKIAPEVNPDGILWSLIRLDWMGSALFFGSMTCILIPLQWGGIARAWSDKLVIALFVLGISMFIIFLLWELRIGEKAILPLYFLRQRTTVGAAISAFMVYVIVSIGTYYLPLYYQSAERKDAMHAGFQVLPFMLLSIAGTAFSTIFIRFKGHPRICMIAGPLIATIPAGLLYWELATKARPSLAVLGILQSFLGFGSGMAMQLCLVMMQAEYRDTPRNVPKASALCMALQLLGGTLGVSIGGALLLNKLETGVERYAPGLSQELVHAVAQSVSAISRVPDEYLSGVIRAYSVALGWVFILCVPAGIIGSVGALLVTNHDLSRLKAPAAAAPPPTSSPPPPPPLPLPASSS